MTGTFRCTHCGEDHPGPPFAYFLEAPDFWWQASEAQRQNGELAEELCIVDGSYFFVKGNLLIPVLGNEDYFAWTVWVSLSKENFERTVNLWDSNDRDAEPPYFGWLSNEIAVFPGSLNLKTIVHSQPVGLRPTIELEPTDHPLAVEQRTGITIARVQEIAEMVIHQED